VPVPARPYLRAARLPGVTRLLVFAVLARVPQTASAVVLTLHVVTTLHLGYAAAGLVATASTIGQALGGPWRARAVDRLGLRRALIPSIVVSTAAWALAPLTGYAGLLVLAAVGGVLSLPVFTVVRQSLAVLAPSAEERRIVFSLDSVGVELSFMIGPAAGVLLATGASTSVAIWGVAGATLLAGLALLVMNPPTVSADRSQEPDDEPLPRSDWFTPSLLAVLGVTAGATVVLAGTDVSIVAHLRETGDVALTGLIFVAWGTGSSLGALVYGGLHRRWSPFGMLALLGVLTVPVGMVDGPYRLMLSILPAAAMCAPVLTATVEAVSRLVPERARGEAMGWHGSALQVGSALGAPLAGAAMDSSGTAWTGFAAVGVAGALLAVVGTLAVRLRRPSVDVAPAVPDEFVRDHEGEADPLRPPARSTSRPGPGPGRQG